MTLANPRVHVALAVSDLDASTQFYQRFFGLEPVKKRPGYAKFELQNPRMNFTLNEATRVRPPAKPAHYGIEVAAPADVGAYATRMREEGLEMLTEDNVTCCYAVMDKFWVHDPDGHAWEVFAITEADVDSPAPSRAKAESEQASSCGPSCC
jgi:catechol 2,3-dioxygenase-like lactoylglutathione lyase family enzyme